jgi:molecular chaperone DnaK
VPTAKSQVFSTAADSQTSVEIHVLQGERPMSADNKSLGKFILDGIMPAPRGIPQVEVIFDIDANGILSVTAKDKATNKTQTIRIEGSTGISKDEVERMKREAEANADADKKKQELIGARNSADNLIYTVEKTLRDSGDKVAAEAKKDIEAKTEALKKVKDTDNIEDVKAKTEELSQAIQKVGADLYQKAQQQQPGQGSAGSGPSGEGGGQQPGDGTQGPKGPEEGQFKEK